MPATIVVLASGTGSLSSSLIEAARDPGYPVRVAAVGVDRGCAATTYADAAGVPHFCVALGDFTDRGDWDVALTDAVAAYEPDLVVSAGFMKLLGPRFLRVFGGRIINTHPALLPAFPGAHGVRDALSYGARVTGSTVHLVDAGIDTGPILAQEPVPVLPGDDVATLHERIKVVERRLLVEIVAAVATRGIVSDGRKAVIPDERVLRVSEHSERPSDTAEHSKRPSDTAEHSERPVGAERQPITRALVSVYDKTGLVTLAAGLHAAGVELVSTGSTAGKITDSDIPVTKVEDLTGFPETLDGRVKTLHPRVHAGILADSRKQEHVDQLVELGVEAFQLVVVNLYPFAQTVAGGATPDECVEQIDIGGPSMVRAAAKNYPSVAVVVDSGDYDDVLAAVQAGGFTLAERTTLAVKAFQHTASYDVAVAGWMSGALAPDTAELDTRFPGWLGGTWERAAVLRYGENPHQAAALYTGNDDNVGVAQAQQLHGKEMSYNNYVDADAAWRAAFDHEGPAVAIIKHANPCGIALGVDIAAAHRKAHACDPVSAFGGVIAANVEVTVEMAQQVAEIFTEVIVAPSYADGAVEVLQRKKNVRILVALPPGRGGVELRPISGGALLQQRDVLDGFGDDPADWTLVAGDPADVETLADLEFAWRACRAVKSNAILLAHDGASVGIGMGQVNRVDAVRLAVQRAGERAKGSVAASDAYFPFPDGPQTLIHAGVRAIVQPGGSVRDQETIHVAREAGVTLYLTGSRHFAH